MAIKVTEDATVEQTQGPAEEAVELPGAFPGDDADGPYPFVFPRLGGFLGAQRRSRSMGAEDRINELTDAQTRWMAEGFGDAWAHVVARMDDPDDQLDDGHIQWLFERLMEARTGRPTTSSRGAQRQPWKNRSQAAPSPQGSGSVTSTPMSSAT